MATEEELVELIQMELDLGAMRYNHIHKSLEDAGYFFGSCGTFRTAFNKLRSELKNIPEDFGKQGSRGTPRVPERDRYIAQGFSPEEMGEIFDVSRQAIEQYAEKTGQNDYWKEKKKIRRNEQKRILLAERKCLVDLLKEQFNQKESEGGIGYKKAIQYSMIKQRRPSQNIEFQKLVNLFEAYFEGKESGEKYSINELDKRSGISFTNITNILRAVGEEPKRPNCTRKKTSDYKKEAIKRAHPLEINVGLLLIS